MITPAEIRKKAERRYRDCLEAWLTGDDSLFPLTIRFRHVSASDEMTEAMQAVKALRADSKDSRGVGYRIEWREIQSRKFGRNQFPDRIVFDTCEDLLGYIGKAEAFLAFKVTVRNIRERFPGLEPWLCKYIKPTCEIAELGIVDGLLDVCAYLVAHPRCLLFARELPVEVDTKFVERHRSKFLRPWLDLLLPTSAIEATESHFERRYGLGYPEPLVQIRFLDSSLRACLNAPANHYALPLSTAANLDLSKAPPLHFIVVENQVNFLTLPPREHAVALLGLGYAVNLFRYLPWLHHRPIDYWGDIDAQGFEILSQFRTWFPQTASLLMDAETFQRHREFEVTGKPRQSDQPLNLTPEEAALFEKCVANEWRLEQEKIPQAWVERILTQVGYSES